MCLSRYNNDHKINCHSRYIQQASIVYYVDVKVKLNILVKFSTFKENIIQNSESGINLKMTLTK